MQAQNASAAPRGPEAVPDMAAAVRDAIAAGRPNMRFQFAFGEIPVIGTLAPEGDAWRLDVRAPVGIVPYSAEDAETRKTLHAAVDAIRGARIGTIDIDVHQTIYVEGARRIEPPMTTVSVVSALVALMMEIRPLIEAVADYLPDLRTALPARRG